MAVERLGALKPALRLASAAVAVALLALSCAGFKHVDSSGATLESRTTFGCLCFLGVCFGALLALSELHWRRFFFLFGFLRYRLGRAFVFAIAGVMMTLMGKTLTDQCDCDSYVLLIVEGVACMAAAVVHFFAIGLFGNNTCPVPSKSAGADTAASTSDGFRLPRFQTHARHQPPSESAFSPVVQPTHSAPEPTPASESTRHEDVDPNMPSWMRS